jgi:predicted RNase H-like HicB family nuclease
MKRTYIALVEHDGKADTAYGVEFPDFPGCFSAADEADDLVPLAREALALCIETMQAEGVKIPQPTPMADIAGAKKYAGRALLLVDVDVPDEHSVRLNIMLPETVLAKVDAYAKRTGQPRSSVLAKAASKYVRLA